VYITQIYLPYFTIIKKINIMALNYRNIEQPVKRLIQDKIRALGLVNTGNFLNSIKVKGTTKGLQVSGVDYFEFLEKKYGIVKSVFESKAYQDLVVAETLKQIDIELKRELGIR
jgi:hypothetical protein